MIKISSARLQKKNRMEYKSELLIAPSINHEFCKNKALDNIIIYRRLAHAIVEKVDKMAKLNIILDLPKRKSKRYKKQLQIYMLSKYSKFSQGSDHEYR